MNSCARTPILEHVLLAEPTAFAVGAAENPHMQKEDGSLHEVDSDRAREQWESLRAAYLDLKMEVAVLPAEPDLLDLVFTANPSLVLPLPDGSREAWLARMTYASRHGEVPIHEAFLRQEDIPIRTMPDIVQQWEGCGDGILHPGRHRLHAGLGPRTQTKGWEILAQAHPELEIKTYALQDPRFYHLDTALAPLDEETALYFPGAFDTAGLRQIHAAFPSAIEVSDNEAMLFACNAHCPDGKHVLIESACQQTREALQAAKFQPIPLDTSEFRKAGGSVFCMKLAY